MDIPQLKIELPYGPAIPLLGIYPKEMKTLIWRYLYPSVKSCIVYNCQDIETAEMSINRWMDKEDVVYIYTHTYTYSFSSSHVQMSELDHKEGWALKNWYFWTVMLKKTLESPLYSKEIKPVSPRGNQPWMFIGRMDAKSWSSNTLAAWCE